MAGRSRVVLALRVPTLLGNVMVDVPVVEVEDTKYFRGLVPVQVALYVPFVSAAYQLAVVPPLLLKQTRYALAVKAKGANV